MKAGDWVHCSTVLASLDPDEFENPLRLDVARTPNRHMTFSHGAHHCAGAHLARRELVIALEEWLTRLPPFRLAPGDSYRTHGGLLGVNYLHLEWD
jgi:cytochrome P450